MSEEAAQRKLILYMSQSLDGFAARRDGTMDWLGRPQPYGAQRQRAVEELLGRAGLLVLGARAGQDMARASLALARPPEHRRPGRRFRNGSSD